MKRPRVWQVAAGLGVTAAVLAGGGIAVLNSEWAQRKVSREAAALIEAYDDPAGVTAAFNKNLLARLNRDFHGDFDLRCFSHEVRWNGSERRIERHLRALADQHVRLRLLDLDLFIRAEETIWTESSHKFEAAELARMAAETGFELLKHWIDDEWPFTEMVFRAR